MKDLLSKANGLIVDALDTSSHASVRKDLARTQCGGEVGALPLPDLDGVCNEVQIGHVNVTAFADLDTG